MGVHDFLFAIATIVDPLARFVRDAGDPLNRLREGATSAGRSFAVKRLCRKLVRVRPFLHHHQRSECRHGSGDARPWILNVVVTTAAKIFDQHARPSELSMQEFEPRAILFYSEHLF